MAPDRTSYAVRLELLLDRFALLLFLGLALSGCSRAESVTPVDPVILNGIVAFFAAKFSWRLARSQLDRHKGFFVRRRAQYLGERDPALISQANQTKLKDRVESEYNAVLAYLNARLGSRNAPGPLVGGAGDAVPGHLDLNDVAKVKVNTSASATAGRASTYRNLRWERIRVIVWRAAALHNELWQPSADSSTATLRTTPMNELVDRRLRAVERMNFQVASGDALGGRTWRGGIQGTHGPWKDGFRVRMFEYARMAPPSLFTGVLGSLLAPPGTPPFSTPHEWRWSLGNRRLEYNVPPPPGFRFPAAQQANWEADGYTLEMQKGGPNAAAIVEALFQPHVDWWHRSWLFCDHVIAAIQIEALRFALRRRHGNDAVFNAIHADNREGYVALSAFVGFRPGFLQFKYLMADPDDPHFNNATLAPADLEVGDQLIFWNSFVYTMISSGDWRLENAIVMDIDSDPQTGGITLDGLKLQGHGTHVKRYPAYKDEIASHFREGLEHARDFVEKNVLLTPAVTQLNYQGQTARLVKWSPYEDFLAPGAWWVRVPFDRWGSAAGAVDAIRKAVKDDSAPGVGYHHAPFGDSVYFPLYEPAMNGGWTAYLAKRRGDAAFRPPRRLQPVRVDGQIMPGIYHRGEAHPIEVVQPKASA